MVGHIDIAQMEREGSIADNIYNDLCVSRYVSCVHIVCNIMLRGAMGPMHIYYSPQYRRQI